MRAFSGKVAMDTYAGRTTTRWSNPRGRATAGEGLTAAHLPAVMDSRHTVGLAVRSHPNGCYLLHGSETQGRCVVTQWRYVLAVRAGRAGARPNPPVFRLSQRCAPVVGGWASPWDGERAPACPPPGLWAARRGPVVSAWWASGAPGRGARARWSAWAGWLVECGRAGDPIAHTWRGGDDRRIAELAPQAADGH